MKKPPQVAPPLDSPSPAALLRDEPWDHGTALGAWLAPAGQVHRRRQLWEATREQLGAFAGALELLSNAERQRAELLTAWVSALLATAFEPDPVAARIARVQRAAFAAAKALAGEPSDSPFLMAFAAEASRRPWGRQPLDELLALAREVSREPRTETAGADEDRCQRLARTFLLALFATEPPSAACDFGAGLYRLGRLLPLRSELKARRFPLALELLAEPVDHRSKEEILAAVGCELERVRILLLRGARAAAEVPLTFRRPTLFLVGASLELLGRIEERPEALLRGPVQLSRWRLWLASRRARRSDFR